MLFRKLIFQHTEVNVFTVRNENKHIFLPLTCQIDVSCMERKPPPAICKLSSEKLCDLWVSAEWKVCAQSLALALRLLWEMQQRQIESILFYHAWMHITYCFFTEEIIHMVVIIDSMQRLTSTNSIHVNFAFVKILISFPHFPCPFVKTGNNINNKSTLCG